MRGYNNNNNNNTTVLLIMIISNKREVIKIPLGKGIVNCREICGPVTRLCSIKKEYKKQLKESVKVILSHTFLRVET